MKLSYALIGENFCYFPLQILLLRKKKNPCSWPQANGYQFSRNMKTVISQIGSLADLVCIHLSRTSDF